VEVGSGLGVTVGSGLGVAVGSGLGVGDGCWVAVGAGELVASAARDGRSPPSTDSVALQPARKTAAINPAIIRNKIGRLSIAGTSSEIGRRNDEP